MRKCEVKDCSRKHYSRGYCNLHYQRMWRTGGIQLKNRYARHGMYKTPTWQSWRAMIQRTTRPNHPKYKHYGGRGITVCPQWLASDGFVNFYRDMGERVEGTTLDRIDVDGNYTPSNCRWATASVQRVNQRITKNEPTQTPRIVLELLGWLLIGCVFVLYVLV